MINGKSFILFLYLMNLKSLPCSVQSVLHGSSLIICIGLLLSCWIILWQINYNEMYYGQNKCFAGNTIATYGGGDCAMYCPNTNIVSSSNISALFHSDLTTYVYHQAPEDIVMEGSETWSSVQSIYIDDDDEEIGWWFNMNIGSSVNMTFTIATDEVYMQIDDEDVGFTLSNTTYNFVTDTIKDGLYSRGYRISFKTDNPNVNGTVGTVQFQYTETMFSKKNATTNETCLNLNLLRGCIFEYDYGDNFCMVQFNNAETRNWGSDYSPYCTNVNQTGRDKAFAGFLIPVTSTLVFIIVLLNLVFAWFVSRRAAHMRAHHEDEITLSSVDKFDSFSAGDSNGWARSKEI